MFWQNTRTLNLSKRCGNGKTTYKCGRNSINQMPYLTNLVVNDLATFRATQDIIIIIIDDYDDDN